MTKHKVPRLNFVLKVRILENPHHTCPDVGTLRYIGLYQECDTYNLGGNHMRILSARPQ